MVKAFLEFGRRPEVCLETRPRRLEHAPVLLASLARPIRVQRVVPGLDDLLRDDRTGENEQHRQAHYCSVTVPAQPAANSVQASSSVFLPMRPTIPSWQSGVGAKTSNLGYGADARRLSCAFSFA